MRTRFRLAGLALLGIALVLALAFGMESAFGLPSETTLRVATAIAFPAFIYHEARTAFPDKAWPRAALALALVANAGIFLTPLVDRPVSRGELILFALPDAAIFLAAWLASGLASGPAENEHQRAVRQQLILGLVVAVVFCAALLGVTLMEVKSAH